MAHHLHLSGFLLLIAFITCHIQPGCGGNLAQLNTHQQQLVQQTQYVHEKDSHKNEPKNIHSTNNIHNNNNNNNSEEDLQDPYQILNELKQERMPQFGGWNPYQHPLAAAAAQHFPHNSFDSLSALHHNKFLPFMGYPQPIFIPYPMYISPEMIYPAAAFSGPNDFEDTMSRASSSRRPSSYNRNNSPIHYVRLPPAPYMFIPGLGYTSQPGTFTPSYSPLMQYNTPLPAVTPFSSIFNLPVNFLANGKPTNIYQMGGSPNDIQGAMHSFTSGLGSMPSVRPPPPAPYRPGGNSGSYLPQSHYGMPAAPSPSTESKLISLKRPFIFNGRPEEIYVLQNSYNPLYSESGLSGYY